MLRKPGHRVPAHSTANIRKITQATRSLFSVFGAPETGKVDIIDLLDVRLPQMDEEFCFEIVEDHVLGDDLARTYPDLKEIRVRESIYYGARNDNGQDVFTLAHELGHFVLHKCAASYARANSHVAPKPYEDSEWQADTFAAEFLMPYEEVLECSSAREVEDRFGVSTLAAMVRFNKVMQRR